MKFYLNNKTRPVGIKKILEANYGKVNGGKNPNAKRSRRPNPYPRGSNARRSREREGRGIGRGGFFKVWRRDGATDPSNQGNKMQNGKCT